jgi:hypothetical protein
LQVLIVPGMFSAFGTFLRRLLFLGRPKELDGAARFDGRNRLQTYWYVRLSLAKPASFALGVLDGPVVLERPAVGAGGEHRPAEGDAVLPGSSARARLSSDQTARDTWSSHHPEPNTDTPRSAHGGASNNDPTLREGHEP